VARTISASPTDTEAAAGTIALADRVYAELVRALYASPVQAVYMAFIFTGYLALVLHAAPDAAILVLGLLALAAWAARIVTAVRLRRTALTAQLDRPAAKRLELLFAVPYGSFAAMLGLIGACSTSTMETRARSPSACWWDSVPGLPPGWAAGHASPRCSWP
jgi:hypothetical protein